MNAEQIIILASGGVIILFLLWFFFGEKRATVAAPTDSRVQVSVGAREEASGGGRQVAGVDPPDQSYTSYRSNKSYRSHKTNDPTTLNTQLSILNLSISGMTCAACVSRIGKHLKRLPEVTEANVHLLANRGVVQYDEAQATTKHILEKVTDNGGGAWVVPEDTNSATAQGK